jgi:queuosine precursor transporter
VKRDDSAYSPVFLALFAAFLTCLIVSNVIAGKLISILGVVLPSAVILFPITYILGDVFTEVYGYRKTRFVIWVGFAANVLMSLVFLAAIALPYPPFFKDQGAYATVLGMTPRIVLASLVAYWTGEFANSITLSLLKKATGGKHLWTRTISSTLVGQAFDTALFISIGFALTVPGPVLVQMMVAQYLFKVAYEIVLTPVTYLVVGAIKRREGVDTFDKGVAYNPFKIKLSQKSDDF